MTEIVIAQDAPVLVAIDIAKARHEVLIAIPGKKRRRRLTVLNQMEDFQRLITSLASYGRPVRFAQVNHRIPLCPCVHCPRTNGGQRPHRHHFFELMSRSMALSNICSANSFFSLPFSSSNARNRFASEGSIPPYFDLYL